jgi:hypothetical protein
MEMKLLDGIKVRNFGQGVGQPWFASVVIKYWVK